MTALPKWNPRYELYAVAHGRDPEAMLAYDKERAPGAHMMHFMFWIQDRWAAFAKAIGCPREFASLHGDEFDAWLRGGVS